MKMVLRPDCADLPYFLRAYFAFKLGLPFGFSKCTRGGGGRAPTCPQWFSIQNADAARPAPPAAPLPPPGTPAAFNASRRRNRRRPPRRSRGSGSPARSAISCARSATACTPARGAPRTPTTTPTTIPCRCQPGHAAPGHHLRRSVRPHPDAGEARAADRGRRRRLPRGRRPARRHGGAQALLARQLPVRAGSGARRSRLQALPAGGARHRRRAAAAHQRADREEPACTPTSRSTRRS